MREQFATPGPLSLDVRIAVGSIEVEAVETDQTVVDLQPMNDGAREILQTVRIEFRDRQDGHGLIVAEPERRGLGFFLRGPEFRVNVRCPLGTSVELYTKTADISTRGRLGPAGVKTASGDVVLDEIDGGRIQSASGDVEVGRTSGDLVVQTASGNVRVGHAGAEVKINAVSGDVAIREALGSVASSSVSGDQEVEIGGGESVALQSVSGDLSLSVRRGLSVWVDAVSVSGATNCALEFGDGPPAEGGPVVELRLKSVSGDIEISRAAAAAAPAA